MPGVSVRARGKQFQWMCVDFTPVSPREARCNAGREVGMRLPGEFPRAPTRPMIDQNRVESRGMDEKSLVTLEYPKVLERLAAFADFSASADLARRMRPTSDLPEAL